MRYESKPDHQEQVPPEGLPTQPGLRCKANTSLVVTLHLCEESDPLIFVFRVKTSKHCTSYTFFIRKYSSAVILAIQALFDFANYKNKANLYAVKFKAAKYRKE